MFDGSQSGLISCLLFVFLGSLLIFPWASHGHTHVFYSDFAMKEQDIQDRYTFCFISILHVPLILLNLLLPFASNVQRSILGIVAIDQGQFLHQRTINGTLDQAPVSSILHLDVLQKHLHWREQEDYVVKPQCTGIREPLLLSTIPDNAQSDKLDLEVR